MPRKSAYDVQGSQYMNGQMMNGSRSQNVYNTIPLCTCYRYTLRDKEEFSDRKAMRVLESWHRVRQAHCRCNLLEDRFTLEKTTSEGKKPFRSWLGYSEIKDFQRSLDRPEYFVLSIHSNRSNRKFYEVYKCKSAQDAEIFEKTCRRAIADPEQIYRGENAVGTVEVKDDSGRARSLSHIEFQTTLDSTDRDFPEYSLYEQNSPTPPEGYEYNEYKQYEKPSPLPQPVYHETYVHSAPAKSPSPPPKVKPASPLPIVRSPSPPPVIMSAAPATETSKMMIVQVPPSGYREPTPAFTAPQAQVSAPPPRIATPPPRIATPPPRIRTPSPVPVVKSVEPVRAQRVSLPQVKPTGTEGVTYIGFDSHTQDPIVKDEGPVYLYACREDDPRNSPVTRIGNSTAAY